MPGNPVQMPYLENSHSQREAHFLIQLRLCPSGKMLDQIVELNLPAQTPENNGFRQPCIARVHTPAFAAQEIGGISASLYFVQNPKGKFTRRRNMSHSFAISITSANRNWD
jgi:hypothetical protein